MNSFPKFNLFSALDNLYRTPSESPAAEPVLAGYRRLCPADLAGPEPIVLTDTVFNEVARTIGSMPAEQGGMFGGNRKVGTVTHYVFDDSARRTTATYSPDASRQNRLLRDAWNPNGIDLLGFVHSHPSACCQPSSGDAAYATRILAAIPAMDRLTLPIAQTVPDTASFALHSFVAVRSSGGVAVDGVPMIIVPAEPGDPTCKDAGFDRVREAYDLPLMARTRLVLVGVGGAAAFAESMARAGVGEFVLIDPDVVELPNIGTQQVYRSDLGRAKVDAVARRILDVNPHARVVGIQVVLDDLTDDMVRRLVHRPLPNTATPGPVTTVLCGLTDNFWAQARVNRLALHFGVPMLAAQVYREGRGVEVSFAIPGVTPACGRCVLGNRYRAHLDRGFHNSVTSHGTPLWATERLNALKGEILLTMVHGSATRSPSDHPARRRYSALLERIGNRNLVVARLDPEIVETLGLAVFDKVFRGADADRIVADETLWLPQEPENPSTGFDPCPDCGGVGDLAACEGTFDDTRLKPEVNKAERTTKPPRSRKAPRSKKASSRGVPEPAAPSPAGRALHKAAKSTRR